MENWNGMASIVQKAHLRRQLLADRKINEFVLTVI